MKELKLSVIIPVYNVEKYIEACVECIYRQGIAEDEFEVILINDGSTDYSLKIIQGLAEKHHNISIISQDNQGPSEARNKGIRMAKGDYIHFMDSDDIVLDGTLRTMLNTALKYQLDILKGDHIKANNQEIEKGITFKGKQAYTYLLKNGEQGFIDDNDPMYCYIWMHLFRRDFLLNKNLFFRNMICFEDTLFITHTYLEAKRFMAIPHQFYVYRRHGSTIMSTMNLKRLYCMNDVIQHIQQLSHEIKLTSDGYKKINNNLFASLTVSLWYLSHHRSLYPHRMEIIKDLKKKVPALSFNGSLKQKFVTFCYKYLPDIYISIRYYMTKTKFD